MNVYPLIFKPILKPRIWGGQRLADLLGKQLPPGQPIGESWEVADLEDDQSIVAQGPEQGKTLGKLVKDWGTDLTGRAELFDGRFPLLIKFLDAQQTLSVQVHPDEAMAQRLGGSVRVKNEAWYVVDAKPDGFIYRGFNQPVTPDKFRDAIESKRVEAFLQRIPVKKGQCYYLPSGTIHALGAGVVVAEVQTPSDVTYRVYDWDRVDASTGQPRELHVERALECIDFSGAPVAGEEQSHVASVWTAVTQLVRCSSFTIERVRMVDGVQQLIPYEEMVVWIVLEGGGRIEYKGGGAVEFGGGDTVVLPASLAEARVETLEKCMWLEVSVPIRSSLAGYDRPARETLHAPGSGFVQLNPPHRTDSDT